MQELRHGLGLDVEDVINDFLPHSGLQGRRELRHVRRDLLPPQQRSPVGSRGLRRLPVQQADKRHVRELHALGAYHKLLMDVRVEVLLALLQIPISD